MAYKLSNQSISLIKRALDGMFNRLKVRLLNRQFEPKQIRIGVREPKLDSTNGLEEIFLESSKIYGYDLPDKTKKTLYEVAERYVDGHREIAKARVINRVEAFIEESKKDLNPELAIQSEVLEVMKGVTNSVKSIVAGEVVKARGATIAHGIESVAKTISDSDPTVAFFTSKDEHVCEECTRLHLLEDKITPRAWKLSEVGHGYHKRGDSNPKMGLLHPNCRCQLVYISPGYGFKAGKLSYISPEHDEYKAQREG